MESETKAVTCWSAAREHERELRRATLGEAIRAHSPSLTPQDIILAAESYLKFIKGGDEAA